MVQRYRRMEDQKSWPSLVLDQEFSKGRGRLNQKLKMKISRLGDVCK